MENPIQAEKDFYKAHKAEYVKKYLGKEVLIYKQKLCGVFDNPLKALQFAKSHDFARNKFMIHTVVEKEPKIRVWGMWSANDDE